MDLGDTMNEVAEAHGGLIDRTVDGQVNRIVNDKLSPAHFKVLAEHLMALAHAKLPGVTGGELVLGCLDAMYVGNEEEVAQELSDASLSFWDAEDHKHMAMGAGESSFRPLLRMRLRIHARPKIKAEHPDWSFQQVKEKLDREWTDERVSDCIRQAAHKHHGVGAAICEGVSDWWEWLKKNWSWQIFFSVLGLLLMFII